MKTLRDIFSEFGITAIKASRAGISYNTIAKHLSGERKIGVKSALLYEKLLGIPRWRLRPDLWPEPDGNTDITPPSTQEEA